MEKILKPIAALFAMTLFLAIVCLPGQAMADTRLADVTFDADGGKFANGESENTCSYNVETNILFEKVSHTQNIDDEGTRVSEYEERLSYWNTVTIPYATEISVSLDYGTECSFDYVKAWKDVPSSQNADGVLEHLYGENGSADFTVDGDTVTFFFYSARRYTWETYRIPDYNYGYFATVSGLGARSTRTAGSYEEPTREGFTFAWWYDEFGNRYESEDDLARIPSSVSELKAHWVSDDVLDWGVLGEVVWEIQPDGTLRIYPINGVSGRMASLEEAKLEVYPWVRSSKSSSVTSIVVEDTVYAPADCHRMFAGGFSYGLSNARSADLRGLDLDGCTTVSNMFYSCLNLASVDFGDNTLPAVEDASQMFSSCSKLVDPGSSKWALASASNLERMFEGCTSLESVDLSSWCPPADCTANNMLNAASKQSIEVYINDSVLHEVVLGPDVVLPESTSCFLPYVERGFAWVNQDDPQKAIDRNGKVAGSESARPFDGNADAGRYVLTRKETCSIPFYQKWEGDAGHEDERPGEVSFALYVKGQSQPIATKTLTSADAMSADTWKGAFEDVDVFDGSGNLIAYEIRKDGAESQEPSYIQRENAASNKIEISFDLESDLTSGGIGIAYLKDRASGKWLKYSLYNNYGAVTRTSDSYTAVFRDDNYIGALEDGELDAELGEYLRHTDSPQAIEVVGDEPFETTHPVVMGGNVWHYRSDYSSDAVEFYLYRNFVSYSGFGFKVDDMDIEPYTQAEVVFTSLYRKKDVTVTKEWSGGAGRAAVFKVFRNGRDEAVKTVVLTSDNAIDDDTWSMTISGLDAYDENGRELTYSVEEFGQPYKYEKSYPVPEGYGLKLHFNNPHLRGLPDYSTESFGFYISYKYNGEWYHLTRLGSGLEARGNIPGEGYAIALHDLEIIVPSTEIAIMVYNNSATHPITIDKVEPVKLNLMEGHVPQYGSKFEYDELYVEPNYDVFEVQSISEIPLPTRNTVYHYVWNESEPYPGALEVRNRKADVTFEKVWDDEGYEDLRPSEATFRLYRSDDPDTEIASTTLSSQDADEDDPNLWIGSFDGVPVFDGNGEEIDYTVKEDPVNRYASTFSSAGGGLVVTNTVKTLSVSKKAATGEDELSGASLRIVRKSDGEVIDSWVSGDRPHTVTGLLDADTVYVLEETAPAPGYTTANGVEFSVSDGALQEIVIRDEPTKVSVSKKASGSDSELAGGRFEVQDGDGHVVESFTSTASPHVIEGKLVVGETYSIVEKAPPAGYTTASPRQFTVEDAPSQSVTMEDAPTKVTFYKYAKGSDGEQLAGAKMAVIDDDENVVMEFSTGESPISIAGVFVVGKKYVLVEEEPPAGYVTASPVEFEVDDATSQDVVMEDAKTAVSIVKTASDTEKPLAGAELRLSDEDGKVVAEWTSSDKAYLLEGVLVAGSSYTLDETEAPEGYEMSEKIVFEVDDADQVQEIVMVDKTRSAVGQDDGVLDEDLDKHVKEQGAASGTSDEQAETSISGTSDAMAATLTFLLGIAVAAGVAFICTERRRKL